MPQNNSDAIAHALRHTWYALVRCSTPRQGLEGVQKQGFWVLGALLEGPKRMTELAEVTQISSASLTGIVDRLEDRGLAHRVRSEQDRRVVTVELTEQGREEMVASNRDFETRVSALLEPLTAPEREQLLTLLTKMSGRTQTKAN